MRKSNSKLKILYITSSSDLYGSDRCLLNLLKNLDFQFKPIVLLPSRGPLEKEIERLEIRSYRINIPVIERTYNPFRIIYFFLLIFSSAIQISSLIKKNNIKIVHTNTSLVITGGIAAKLTGIKHIWHIREIISQESIRKILSWFIYYMSDKIVVMSNAIKDSFFREKKDSKKIAMLYEGISPEEFDAHNNGNKIRKEFNIDSDICVVGMAGRITPWKGQDDFIKAAALVLKEVPNTKFFILGDIYPRGIRQTIFKNKLKYIAKKMKISDKIIFVGFREDIFEFMAAFDIFVLPSNKPEPFGMVILEAMSMAKTVIATNIGGPSEIINDGITGILVPPKNPFYMAQAILDLAKDGFKRYKLGTAGKGKVIKLFNIENFQQRLNNLYYEILALKQIEKKDVYLGN